ncbi:MAG: biotin carboxylase N-terminal domain-containing protein, partial [Thermodesulfobacteriota bacterium]
MQRLLIANRGEVAVRVLQAASELGLATVAVFSEDDAGALHVRRAERSYALRGRGAAAYLDAEQLVAAARATDADAVHPGYGFLAESAEFARRCEEAGLVFVGPRPETLSVFGDKTRARDLAVRCGVPVLRGSEGAVSLEQAEEFFAVLGRRGAVLLKAVAGGGGRGMRVVRSADELRAVYERCRSEARSAFGSDEVYVEELLAYARHVEVQVLGDEGGAVVHLGERECSLQRRHQKIVEIAPCPSLSSRLRARLADDAVRMAKAVQYRNAGTFEFLIDAGAASDDEAVYAFIEANPRLQVEHTVTEEVLGVDLVRLQLELARGARLSDFGLLHERPPAPVGYAIQVRVNAEAMAPDGSARPSAGTLRRLVVPSGRGVRVDTAAVAGEIINPNFAPLLLKVVCHASSDDFADAAARAARALRELETDGVATNAPFLRRLVAHPEFVANRIHTRFVDEHLAELARPEDLEAADAEPDAGAGPGQRALAGARVDPDDPLAV